MPRKQKEKLYKSVVLTEQEHLSLERAQEAIRPHLERMSDFVKSQQPTFQRLADFQKQIQENKERKNILVNYRSTESLILDELRELNASEKKVKDTDLSITYDQSGTKLYREVNAEEYSHDLRENAKRRKFLDILLKRRTYVGTTELLELLGSRTPNSIAKLAASLNDALDNDLELNGKKVIIGKAGSGYRINPKILIIKE